MRQIIVQEMTTVKNGCSLKFSYFADMYCSLSSLTVYELISAYV